jgi:hypothetical protein
MRSFFTSIVTLVLLSACGGGGDNRSAANSDSQPAAVLQLQAAPSAIETTTSSALAAKAVDLTDAIAILKMIVGLDVNPGGAALTAYQSYAADVDGNGKVELSDAISVLKRIVGLETATANWMFFNGTPTVTDKLNPGLPASVSAAVSSTTEVSMKAVLRGDVVSSSAFTYSWALTSVPSGSTATLTNITAINPSFKADVAGSYVATMTITDGSKNVATSSVTLTACNASSNSSSPFSGCDGNTTSVVDGWPIFPALSVKVTSYENKNLADLTRTQVPIDAVSGKILVPTSVTFGDFFQEGQYSAFVVSTDGQAYFLRWKTTTSSWVDDSARLFGSGSRNTCNATYAITADFNGDGKPDVFLSCSGTSNQLMFVSAGATYVRLETQISVDGNRAAAADIDGDGILDVVLTKRNDVPQVWKGNAGGVTFTQQTNPAWLVTATCNGFTLPTNVDSVFLVSGASGRVDLVVGGIAAVGGQPYVLMQKQNTPPYFTTCNGYSKGFQQIYDASNNNASLRDLVYQSNKYYLLTQSNLTNQIQLSSYTVNAAGNPVNSITQRLTESATGAGLPQQYKYNAGYFQPYDAGCALNRCAASANINFTSETTVNTVSQTRIVAFGDTLVDVGQTGRVDANNNNTPYRYTVNLDRVDSNLPNTGTTFIDAIASYFGFASVSYALDNLTSGRLPSTGAYSYGEFGALVSGAANFGGGTSEPTDGTLQVADARGCQKIAASKTSRNGGAAAANAYCAYNLQAQIDLFLAQGAPTSNDLFVISIGTGDIMATGIRGMGVSTFTPYVGLDDIQTLLGGPLTSTAAINLRMQTAANALAVQVKRLTDAGAKYVLVVGPPNVGRSPWAAETGYATLMQNLSYNTGSGVISMGSEGLARLQATFGNQANNPVLFVEISGLVNTLTDGTNATFANKATPACASTANTSTTVNAKSIGTGLKPAASVGSVPAGRLSAALCTTATLNGDPSSYVYADGVNFTPAMQSQIYNQSLFRMRLAAWIN